jgi:hypothetical protein
VAFGNPNATRHKAAGKIAACAINEQKRKQVIMLSYAPKIIFLELPSGEHF